MKANIHTLGQLLYSLSQHVILMFQRNYPWELPQWELVPWLKRNSHSLRNKDSDQRTYPGSYCHVLVSEGDERVVRPMRYQCRLAGKPAFYDRKFPGTCQKVLLMGCLSIGEAYGISIRIRCW